MIELLQGIVTKTVGGVFFVESNSKKYECFAPKKLRHNNFEVLVGDKVKFSDLHKGKGSIEQVLPRKNRLNRPEVANVDVCFLVLAAEPQPDFYLADKVLINCFQEKIEPVVVVNKTDLDGNVFNQACENYQDICDVISLSAFVGNTLRQLDQYLTNGVVACFAGQSAVGKTSLLNALLPTFKGKTGDISQKSGRGMHTTRHISLQKLSDGYIIDTCGFSLCSLQNIKSSELRLYLDDFVALAHGCKYPSCTHTAEPDCAVKAAVRDGTLNADRYARYLEEYAELVEAEKNRY
ncbi:MAG: ribosome small subunit-dependent GTPase A [Corallococcus sp.]|nr:ribosome small subunit-dependent GTPase A [Corallococcus sp.]MCM1359151.1 ribosome small subunit-dependent GTPase A [Corallococcus sp.]MCM1394541.1 ribosome small subunit-dependent GTPase A [Corallococcus sp.]